MAYTSGHRGHDLSGSLLPFPSEAREKASGLRLLEIIRRVFASHSKIWPECDGDVDSLQALAFFVSCGDDVTRLFSLPDLLRTHPSLLPEFSHFLIEGWMHNDSFPVSVFDFIHDQRIYNLVNSVVTFRELSPTLKTEAMKALLDQLATLMPKDDPARWAQSMVQTEMGQQPGEPFADSSMVPATAEEVPPEAVPAVDRRCEDAISSTRVALAYLEEGPAGNENVEFRPASRGLAVDRHVELLADLMDTMLDAALTVPDSRAPLFWECVTDRTADALLHFLMNARTRHVVLPLVTKFAQQLPLKFQHEASESSSSPCASCDAIPFLARLRSALPTLMNLLESAALDVHSREMSAPDLPGVISPLEYARLKLSIVHLLNLFLALVDANIPQLSGILGEEDLLPKTLAYLLFFPKWSVLHAAMMQLWLCGIVHYDGKPLLLSVLREQGLVNVFPTILLSPDCKAVDNQPQPKHGPSVGYRHHLLRIAFRMQQSACLRSALEQDADWQLLKESGELDEANVHRRFDTAASESGSHASATEIHVDTCLSEPPMKVAAAASPKKSYFEAACSQLGKIGQILSPAKPQKPGASATSPKSSGSQQGGSGAWQNRNKGGQGGRGRGAGPQPGRDARPNQQPQQAPKPRPAEGSRPHSPPPAGTGVIVIPAKAKPQGRSASASGNEAAKAELKARREERKRELLQHMRTLDQELTEASEEQRRYEDEIERTDDVITRLKKKFEKLDRRARQAEDDEEERTAIANRMRRCTEKLSAAYDQQKAATKKRAAAGTNVEELLLLLKQTTVAVAEADRG